MKVLFETLQHRRRPEDVAQMALELLGDALNPQEQRTLKRAASGSLKMRL